ncbi:MAG TPA: S41 family peptidase [Candidatus Limnocylindrales bacterium]|nr:S41 family peptidase [Candidatus Limnocylindrales bacterium]
MLPTDPAPDPSAPSGPGPADPAPPPPGAAADTYTYLQAPVTLQPPAGATPIPRTARQGPAMLAVAIGVVAVLAGGALFMSGVLVGQRIDAQPGTPTSRADAFQPFWDTYEAIEDQYAGGEVNQEAIIRGAIRGMVEALEDPYSSYLTPEEYQSGLQDLSGQFEGIGAEIGTRTTSGETSDCATLGPDCILIVVSPLEGSPAKEAGLLAGDAILEVDGSALDGLTVDAARDRVRGRKGTTVVLTIQRGTDAPFDVPIVRDVIVQREVIERDLAGGTVGYIGVTGFSDNAAAQFHEALRTDLDAGRKKIILDLRGNPGGYVTAARRIASEFIGSGPLFWEEDADGKQLETNASSGGLATSEDIEVVVLVDRGSASASEIVAGALQDRGRATLIGETTFGKGTVQQWIELQDNGALKLTIAKWLTPDKRWIHRIGIVPDVAVPAPEQPDPEEDPALDRALETLSATGAVEGRRAA